MSQGDKLSDPSGPDFEVDTTCAKPTSLKQLSGCSTHKENPTARSHSSFEPVILKVHSSLDPDVHFHVRPEILIHRASLPLYCLDCTRDHTSLPRNPFSGHVDPLESGQYDHGQQASHNILIARIDGYKALHAIERIYEGVYTICKLQSWVTVTHLTQPQLRRTKQGLVGKLRPTQTEQWWDQALFGALPLPPRKRRKLLDTAEPDCPPKVAETSRVEAGSQDFSLHVETQPRPDSPIVQTPVTSQKDVPVIVEDVLVNVVQQYLETLYLSKAPLTYFAKGPLSRARARVPSDSIYYAQYTKALASGLRSIVSSTNAIDKKYRETLPALIKGCSQAELSAGNREAVNQPSHRKKRKSKKLRLGKDGLLPNEEEQVSKWWALDDSRLAKVSTAHDLDNVVKRQLASLRFRDNLMQMILALEVLALEKAADKATTFNQMEINIEVQDQPQETQKKSATRTPYDLKLYLDVLLDRLCIWQSTAMSESTEAKRTILDDNISVDSEQDSSKDHLKDFCVDVIVPFYGGRLSSIVEGLACSLGIKTGPSPVKGPLRRVASNPNDSAPGTEVKRKIPSDGRRQLKRVSTLANKPLKAPPATLARSSTDPLIQGIKRERSLTPQLPLSLKAEKRSFSRTNSMSQSRSFSQREVDFSAINKYNETKSKKKAKVEEELKEAIATLKKPNRVSAVKDYFDEKEQRTTTSQIRPGTKIQRKSTLNVQVGATPKKAGKTFMESYDQKVDATIPKELEDSAVSSTNTNVPGSVLRPRAVQVAPDSTAGPRVRASRPNMAFETPSKPTRFYKPSSRIGESIIPDSSPAHSHSQERSNLMESPFPTRQALKSLSSINFAKTFTTPAKQTGVLEFGRESSSAVSTFQTSIEKGRTAQVEDLSLEKQASSRSMEPSIYEKLGWTEDDLDELL